MRFKVKRKYLTEEEKRDRAERYNYAEEFDQVDVEEFVKQDIYDEYIDFKCLDCKDEVELEADIVFELFNPEYEEYPVLICNECGGNLVPLDIYNALKEKKKRKK